jgi:hypothetical protein
VSVLDDRQVGAGTGTGPMVGTNPVQPLKTPPPPSAVRSQPGLEALERARRIRAQWGADSPEKAALLGILLARLSEVPFEDVAEVLGVRPARLEKLMHGEEQVPGKLAERWLVVADVIEDLQAVLLPRATARWLRTSVPALGDRTPLDAIKRGMLGKVREVTAGYRSEAFS